MNLDQLIQYVRTGWPSLSQRTAEVFAEMILTGRLAASAIGDYRAVDRKFFHRVAYAAAGVSAPIQFFNTQAQPGICNLNGSTLTGDRPLLLTGVSVTIEDGTITGNSLATTIANVDPVTDLGQTSTGANVATDAAELAEPITRAAQIDRILAFGGFRLRVQDTTLFETETLYDLPSGGGLSLQGFAARMVEQSNATSPGYGAMIARSNNGDPFAANQKRFPFAYPILPDQRIDAQITFPEAIALTGGGVIKLALHGVELVKVAN